MTHFHFQIHWVCISEEIISASEKASHVEDYGDRIQNSSKFSIKIKTSFNCSRATKGATALGTFLWMELN
jgi:hypothetical protein